MARRLLPVMIRASVAGASGYAGGELLRLLAAHPGIEVGPVAAGSSAGQRLGDLHPNLTTLADRPLLATDARTLADAEVVFLALPHGESAALVAESRVLCHPASVDSIPSSAGREDHVSMGMTAALKARQVAEHARHVLAIELLVAAQALDFREPGKTRPGKGVAAAHALIRSRVPHMETDRELHRDISAVAALIDSGELLDTVRRAVS